MKKILFIIGLFLIACNSFKKLSSDKVTYKRSDKNWQQDFKDRVFCNCLLAAIDDKLVTDKTLLVDKSFHDPIDVVLEDDIKNILKPVVLKIKEDSLESINQVAEGGAGKRVFDNCLKFYKSKVLDSLAKVKFKKWNKINVDSIMSAKAPAF